MNRHTLTLAGVALAAFAAGAALRPAPTPALAQDPSRADAAAAESNERFPQPGRVEKSYPLAGDAARATTVRAMQQVTVDLLAVVSQYKQAHWNLNGPLYLVLHEYYDEQAAEYLKLSDGFAERALHMGASIDGRYSTIARTSKLPDFPAGYVTDTESLQLLIDRVTVLQKEVYGFIRETEETDPVTSNQLQELAFAIDKNLWQLRIHLARPGSNGEALPYAPQQARPAGRVNAGKR